uniref:Uncharacterized protein n=1 Tax=Glossina palpalis gambiensis TaxID=67801 RepID=A0A1B0ANJ0_9MUSC
MWPPSYKISNKDFYSFIFRSKDKQEELFGLEKVYLNRLINILPPTMLEQLQYQRALTLTRSVMPSTFWNLSRNGLTPYQLERHLLSLNNMFMETITPRTSSIQPEHISNNLPTGNILNDVFLRLQINSQNAQLTETNAIASCFGAINRADIMHMHRATAHATVAQFANDYQTLQMLKHFINIPATTTTASITSCYNPESTLKTSKEYFHNSLNRFNCKTFPSRNTHESREQRLPRKRFRTENIADRSNDPNFVQNCDNADNLLPPPKKNYTVPVIIVAKLRYEPFQAILNFGTDRSIVRLSRRLSDCKFGCITSKVATLTDLQIFIRNFDELSILLERAVLSVIIR